MTESESTIKPEFNPELYLLPDPLNDEGPFLTQTEIAARARAAADFIRSYFNTKVIDQVSVKSFLNFCESTMQQANNINETRISTFNGALKKIKDELEYWAGKIS